MGPFLFFHVASVGFFSCAALYSAWNWWLTREEPTLLIFSAQCVLCAGMTISLIGVATAPDARAVDFALSGRFVFGILGMALSAVLISRVTGVQARAYLAVVIGTTVAASLLHLLSQFSQETALTLRHVVLPWGERIAVPVWQSPPWWFPALYAVVLSVDLFGIYAASRLIRRDRLGGALVLLAAAGGFISSCASFVNDRGLASLPYFGNLPFAIWVALVALQLSRENARVRLRRATSEQRLRGIFDQTLHFMGLLDIDGAVIDVNRTLMDAAAVPASELIGRPFWQTVLWAHSPEFQERIRLAVQAAAAGETVRFETWHPLPSGGTGYVDFSLKPIVDEQGKVVLLMPEGRDITARKKTQAALDRIVEVIAPRTGQDFFQTMVDTLCGLCEADMAMVAAIDLGPPAMIRTIAVSRRGKAADNFTYSMQGTPCATVVGCQCYYPHNVQLQFPEDRLLAEFEIDSYMGIGIESSGGESLGLISVLGRSTLRHPKQARSLLHVIASRAGAELERRRADAALLASESRFRTLIEGIDIGVLLQDAHDRVLVSNPAAARVLGLSAEQLHGATSSWNPGWALVKEDGTPYPPGEVPSVVAARTRLPVRNAIVGTTNRLTGAPAWLQVTATPHFEHDGTLLQMLVTIVDVTDRKRAEEVVRSSARRLSLAISATSDAVWEWNYRTGETYYSPRWFEMLDVAPDMPMTIETWRSICHPDDLAPTIAQIESMLESGESPGYEVEYRARRADGTWIWVLARGNVVEWDAEGRPLILAGTNTDITPRKEAEARRRDLEARLAQSQRMESMGRLAGGIAHDFNNLLTIINGYSELLLHSGTQDEASREMLEDISNAGERAAALTRQLLTFSRHQVIDPVILELNDVVSDTERMLRRLIGEHIHLHTCLTGPPLWVRADAGQIGQVIVNLAVNARDAMPEGGVLTVNTTLVTLDEATAATIAPDAHPGRYAVLSVADTGTGIPADLQELVFEPFFTTKGPGKGTGLGLTTVDGIVRQCGGFLSVTSVENVGSTFTVYLPAAAAPGERHQSDGEDTFPAGSRKTVLMVEDESAVRSVVQLMLQRLGFDVLVAPGGDEALRIAGAYTGDIDLLLTDLVMPGLNGRELSERILAIRPFLRVLYMSGHTDDSIVKDVVLHTNAAFLQKPFDAEALLRKVHQALNTRPPEAVD